MEQELASTLLDFVHKKGLDRYESESEMSDLSDMSHDSDFPEYGRSFPLSKIMKVTDIQFQKIGVYDVDTTDANNKLTTFVNLNQTLIDKHMKTLAELGKRLVHLTVSRGDKWKAVLSKVLSIKRPTSRTLIHYIWRNAVSNLLSESESNLTELPTLDEMQRLWQAVEDYSWDFATSLRTLAIQVSQFNENQATEWDESWEEITTHLENQAGELGSQFVDQANNKLPSNNELKMSDLQKIVSNMSTAFLNGAISQKTERKGLSKVLTNLGKNKKFSSMNKGVISLK